MKVISNLIDEIINIKKNNPNDERLTNLIEADLSEVDTSQVQYIPL